MRTAVAVAVLTLLAPPAARAQAPSFVIRQDKQIGSFAVQQDGTLGGAVRAFGKQTTLRRTASGCLAAWRPYGLTIELYNLAGQDPCSRRFGLFARGIMRGPRWRTARGLRIGAPAQAIRSFHPRSSFQRGLPGIWPSGWWLVTRYSRIGGGGRYPALIAETRNGIVASFQIRYAAGGD